MRFRLLSVPALAIVTVVAASCTDPPSAEPAADPAFKVALLSPGPVSDAGWNALAYEGSFRQES